jgi:glycosyltransferase involved in cell wall biosynthesis
MRDLAALVGWAVARIRRVPFVLEVRDVWPRVLVDMGAIAESSMLYAVLHRVERFLYRRADRVVILAAGVRTHVLRFGVDDAAIRFIPNGADCADFKPTAPRTDLRSRYGFDGVVAVYTGAHGPANGLDLLLDAAAELAVTCPNLRIVLVGDGAEKPHLVERATREGLRNVRFMDPVPKGRTCSRCARPMRLSVATTICPAAVI